MAHEHEYDHDYMHAHNIPHDHGQDADHAHSGDATHDHGEGHEHTHVHVHEHTHADGTTHTHEHGHTHSHAHGQGCPSAAAGCASDCANCDVDPKAELVALMRYMVNHNAAHANELAQLADRLKDMGEGAAYEQVMQAVSDFEKGNLRLSAVLSALTPPKQ